jgi:CheY-like chemotaxis protein
VLADRGAKGVQVVRCVAVSANAMPDEIRQALSEGFNGPLTEPVHARDLLAEVDSVRRAAAAAA